MRLPTLKNRADFKRVRGGARASTPAFALEGRPRSDGASADAEPTPSRAGLVITKKLGNAVLRNRIRRRLKHAMVAARLTETLPAYDFVFVARQAAVDRAFSELVHDIETAVARIQRAAADVGDGHRARRRRKR